MDRYTSVFQGIAGAARRHGRARGISLVEVVAALGLFCVMVLSGAFTLVRGIEHRKQSFQIYEATSALRDLLAEIQETANKPTDLPNQIGIGAIYTKYNGKSSAVAILPSGQIAVTCYANELTVPARLGGPQDLNLDGDGNDDLGNQSAGTDLKIVPMTLTLTYMDRGNVQTLSVDRLVTRTTN